MLEGALESNGGPGKVVNGGETATVKVGNDNEFTLEEVENPVPEAPQKRETAPYEGNGVLGGVKVGDEITYEISYKNYKAEAADVVIKDKLDKNVALVSASDNGRLCEERRRRGHLDAEGRGSGQGRQGHPDGEGAGRRAGEQRRPGKVVNGGDGATVKVGNDNEYTLNTVENPVPEEPEKKEITPYEGTGELGGVKVGDEITYEISYKNYKAEAADVTIKDTLDKNVEFVIRERRRKERADGIVTWTLKAVPAGKVGTVTLTVKVLESALESQRRPGQGGQRRRDRDGEGGQRPGVHPERGGEPRARGAAEEGNRAL